MTSPTERMKSTTRRLDPSDETLAVILMVSPSKQANFSKDELESWELVCVFSKTKAKARKTTRRPKEAAVLPPPPPREPSQGFTRL